MQNNVGFLAKNNIFLELSAIIAEKQDELLRVTNTSLITLFWEVGAAYNRHENKNKTAIDVASTQLVARYGPYFTVKNLKNMGRFADNIDVVTAKQIAPYVSWEHISLLLQLKYPEAWLFYINVTVSQSLTVNALRQQISANLFDHSKTDKGVNINSVTRVEHARRSPVNNSHFLKLLKQQKPNPVLLKNFFKVPLVHSFRPLIEHSNGPEIQSKNKKTLDSEADLFKVLFKHIEKFRHSHNIWLNAKLNILFWEIGKQIQEILSDDNHEQTSTVQNAAVQLEKRYGKIFDEKQLYQMAIFFKKITDLTIAYRISSLVTWECILVLLPLDQIEAILFYARLTATEQLTVSNLQLKISQNTFEQTSGAKEREQAAIATIKNPIKKLSVKREGNRVLKIENKIIDYGEDGPDNVDSINVLENSYFWGFVNAFKKKA